MFEPKKRRMSLRDYLQETHKPNECFSEDRDYIYFRNRPDGLCIVIDKNTYYADKLVTSSGSHHAFSHSELHYFDIMSISYRMPRIPKNSTIRIMFGRYYVTNEPCFFLTEPKHATHALIFDLPKYPNYYKMDIFAKPKYNGQEYIDNLFQVIPRDSIFDWISRFTYMAETVKWERERFLKQCQIYFFKQLENFYCQA